MLLTFAAVLDLVETSATPMLAPPTVATTIQSYFDARTITEDSVRARAVLEHKIQPYIEAIAEIFDCLSSLVPSLQDPVPWDDYQESEPGESLAEGIERAKRMFRKAPPGLVERLGYANSKRNRYLQDLRQRAFTTFPKTTQCTPKRLMNREFRLPASIPLRVSKTTKDGTLQPVQVDLSHRAALSSGASTTSFTESTTFSNNKTATKVYSPPATSIAETEESKTQETAPEVERYLVPKPPITLEPQKAFICPYCLHEVTVGDKKASEKDWVDHVYMDLEPYMCTYELCPREQKMYGSKEDWFQHELDTHRIPKVYLCQTCEFEYERQESFEQHLTKVHDGNLQPEELAIIASMCERFSKTSLKNQECHLCGEMALNAELLRDHIADHLEQFALASIKCESEFEEDLPLSPQISDSGSERRFRLGLGGLEDLELMVEERIEPILQQTPTRKQSAGNVDFEDSNMQMDGALPGSAKRSGRPSIGKRGNSYTITSRVKEHLDQHSAVVTVSERSSKSDSMNVAVGQASSAAQPLRTVRTGLAPRKVEFEGRIQDLKELYNNLSIPGYTCFLSGRGGIGKSALAAEYTYRFETEYSYIFWVQAETPIVCTDAYSQIATKVVLNAQAARHDQGRLIMLTREFLEKTTKRWLLVFDNVDEWLDLKRLLPTNFPDTSGSILVTTQRVDLIEMTSWSKLSQVSLGALSLDESRRLLLKYTQPGLDPTDIRSHSEFKLAGDIAKLAERLPLALSLISGYILVSRCSLTDFVELWKERRRNMQRAGEISSSLTDAALETAWNLGLREVPVDARDLLNILAFLDPDTIQTEMLIDEHEEKILEMLHSTEAGRSVNPIPTNRHSATYYFI
jgi:hypothetical protein